MTSLTRTPMRDGNHQTEHLLSKVAKQQEDDRRVFELQLTRVRERLSIMEEKQDNILQAVDRLTAAIWQNRGGIYGRDQA